MAEHELDGEMGLAGVGRPEHCGDTGTTGASVAGCGRRKRKRHQISRVGMARIIGGHAFSVSQRDAGGTGERPRLKKENESGTNRGRIGDSQAVELCSPRYVVHPASQNHNIG
jgi:hypothetical protein